MTTHCPLTIRYLTLRTFSATGGIEQYNRCVAMALGNNAAQYGWQYSIWSLYDKLADERYVNARHFKGFAGRKTSFVTGALRQARLTHVLIISHINLALPALLAKLANPRLKLVVVAHGIEVWQKLSPLQRWCLTRATAVWPVSHFTASILTQQHRVPEQKIRVLYNTVNPFFVQAVEAPALEQEYNLTGLGAPLLLTVARIKRSEHAKGYDTILGLLPALLQHFPQLTYVLAGPCEAAEQERIVRLATSLGVQQRLVFTGDVPTTQLPGLYSRCQVFAMPSTKEGFGIVYLEAALCGCQVVACHAGGAPEALLQGKLGYLAQPGDTNGLLQALIDALENPLSPQEKSIRKKMVEEHFGFGYFTRSIAQLIHQLF